MLVKWLKVGNGYLEEFVVPNLKGEEKEKFEKFSKAMQPLLKRLDEATGKMLLPALADGQVAFVLDAKLTSKQWIQQMPKSDKPLPMLEPAVVAGVSDAALLEKAIGEYRAIVNEFIAKLRELEPKADIPDFKIPEPDIRKVAAGKILRLCLAQGVGPGQADHPQRWAVGQGGRPDHLAGAQRTSADQHAPEGIHRPAGRSQAADGGGRSFRLARARRCGDAVGGVRHDLLGDRGGGG